MGLDITACSKLVLAANPAVDEDGEPIAVTQIKIPEDVLQSTERNFLGRADGLEPGLCSYTELDDFRAGSYSGYNLWRDALCRMIHGISAEQFWKVNPPG